MAKNLLQRGFLSILSLLLFLTSWSQGKTVTGTVLDEKGTPLSGATVTVKNTTVSTGSNAQGVFTLSVPANGRTLVVTYVGMQEREVSIGNATNLRVTLSANAASLTDVVVVGYGRARRVNLTTAQT